VTSLRAVPSDNVEDDVHPLVQLMRRYVFAYTCCHDFSECRRVMVDDYVLCMGEHRITGRDGQYTEATAKQFRQFPGLGLTVHDLVVGEDRIAMHFTEHGRSMVTGRLAAWSGVSLYRWNGERLTECRVEQDYFGRRGQLSGDSIAVVPVPAIDPWSELAQQGSATTERAVRDWLQQGGLFEAPVGSLDNEYCADAHRALGSDSEVSVLDMFTAGDRAAFHALVRGRCRDGFGGLDSRNRDATLYVAGLATVRDGRVEVRAVTDRLAAERRLLAASAG
jgi:predicted ester cyclase